MKISIAMRTFTLCIVTLFPALALADVSMRLSSTCDLNTEQIRVQVWNPPGGYVPVDAFGNFTTKAPEGTELIVSYLNRTSDRRSMPTEPLIQSGWQPSKNGGVLEVRCLDVPKPCPENPDGLYAACDCTLENTPGCGIMKGKTVYYTRSVQQCNGIANAISKDNSIKGVGGSCNTFTSNCRCK